MPNPTITIPLDPQTAQAYNSASPQEKRKLQALLSLRLRELASGEYPSLQKTLDELARKAKDRGLTAEILASLLKGE
ncbi:MAG: hypothetical protein JST77_17090 [Acidobacteria bacterium]|nr:hypothetical protein [Acidobacteriota bacterium]